MNEESYKHSVLKHNGIVDEQHYSGKPTISVSLTQVLVLTFELVYLGTEREAWIILRSDQNFMIWRENTRRGFGRCHSAYPGQKLKQLMVYYAKISLYDNGKLF